MQSKNKKIVINLDDKGLIALIIIIALVFFTLITYVNAVLTFHSSTISEYVPKRNKSPVADAGPDQRAYINETLFFDGAGSSDPDGKIESYSWGFGDETSASGVNVSHVYASEGVYHVTLTVTDDKGATASDTCIVTIVALTPEEIEALPPDEAAEHLAKIIHETAVKNLVEANVSAAADIFEVMNLTNVLDIMEAAVSMNQTDGISEILLEMDEQKSAAVMVEVEPRYGAEVVESMMGINVTGCARTVEAMVELDVQSTADILEEVETDVLLDLLIEISLLSSTPSTVAAIFEVMSLDKVLEMVRAWVSIEALQELGSVFGYLTPETLNNIYGGLTVSERAAVYPYLSAETIAHVTTELIPLPDLTPTLIKVSRLDSLGYSVTATIKNQGNFESGKLIVDLKEDASLIDQIEVPSVSAGASTEVTYEWKPKTTGAYILMVTVDPDNFLSEMNETNNELTLSYGVELSDLTVTIKTVPTELVEKKSYSIEVEVYNIGEVDTGPFNLTLKASGVTVKARWTSTTVGTSDIQQLATGSSEVLLFSWTPEEAGAYTLEAEVDTEEKVLEGDETNNIDKVSLTIEERKRNWPLIIAMVISVITVSTILLIIFRSQLTRVREIIRKTLK